MSSMKIDVFIDGEFFLSEKFNRLLLPFIHTTKKKLHTTCFRRERFKRAAQSGENQNGWLLLRHSPCVNEYRNGKGNFCYI